MFEFKLISFRGRMEAAAEAELNRLGAEGWEVTAAYATTEGVTTIDVHHFVLKRCDTSHSSAPTKRR